MKFPKNNPALGLYNMETIEAMYASSLHMYIRFIKNKLDICFGINQRRTTDVGYYIKSIQQDIKDADYYINKCLTYTEYNSQAYVNIKSFIDFMLNQVEVLYLNSTLNA